MAGAPPVQRLEHWTLVTSDLERTKRFYGEVLGAQEPANRGGVGPECVRFGNTTIDFFPARPDREPSPGSHGQHHAYVVALGDYDAWVDHLRQRGVGNAGWRGVAFAGCLFIWTTPTATTWS